MGFSWSLYFCQSVEEASVARCLPTARVINNEVPVEFPASRSVLAGQDPATCFRLYIYVDNLRDCSKDDESAFETS